MREPKNFLTDAIVGERILADTQEVEILIGQLWSIRKFESEYFDDDGPTAEAREAIYHAECLLENLLLNRDKPLQPGIVLPWHLTRDWPVKNGGKVADSGIKSGSRMYLFD